VTLGGRQQVVSEPEVEEAEEEGDEEVEEHAGGEPQTLASPQAVVARPEAVDHGASPLAFTLKVAPPRARPAPRRVAPPARFLGGGEVDVGDEVVGGGRARGKAKAAPAPAMSPAHQAALAQLPRNMAPQLRQEVVSWLEAQGNAPAYARSLFPVVTQLLCMSGAAEFLSPPPPPEAEDEAAGGTKAAAVQNLTWSSIRERLSSGSYDNVGRNALVADLRRMLGQNMQRGGTLLQYLNTCIANNDSAALKAASKGREALAMRRFYSAARGVCAATPMLRDAPAEAAASAAAVAANRAKAIADALKKADEDAEKVVAASQQPAAAEQVSDSEEAPDPEAQPEPRSTDYAFFVPDGGAYAFGGRGGGGRGGRFGRGGGRGASHKKRARSESDDDVPVAAEPSDSWDQ